MPTLPHTNVASAQLKRKHDEIVDLASDEDERGQGVARVAKPTAHDEDLDEQRIEDDAASGSDASAFEVILDDVELNPFVARKIPRTNNSLRSFSKLTESQPLMTLPHYDLSMLLRLERRCGELGPQSS